MRDASRKEPSRVDPAADAAGLEALLARASRESGAAPVERWDPAYCGDLDIEIKADGNWFYLGTPIARPALVRLFASVLRKDDDNRTYLVTPVEKIGIRVEDAHFLAVELHASRRRGDQVLTFRTNVGDVVEAGPDHPLRFDIEAGTGGLKPYLLVRGRLEALASRSVMFELVELGEEVEIDGESVFAIRSNGAVFPVLGSSAFEQVPSR